MRPESTGMAPDVERRRFVGFVGYQNQGEILVIVSSFTLQL